MGWFFLSVPWLPEPSPQPGLSFPAVWTLPLLRAVCIPRGFPDPPGAVGEALALHTLSRSILKPPGERSIVICILEMWKLRPRGPETRGVAEKDVKFSHHCGSVPRGRTPHTRTGALPLTLTSLAFESGVGVDPGGAQAGS